MELALRGAAKSAEGKGLLAGEHHLTVEHVLHMISGQPITELTRM